MMLRLLILLVLLMPAPALAEAGGMSWWYESPYDTAPEGVCVDVSGCYKGGAELSPGLYTAEAAGEGTLTLYMGDEPLESYALEAGAHYTVYLAEGMALQLPDKCVLRSFQRDMRFQEQGRAVEIHQARYFTMLEMPGTLYDVTALPGGDAYVMVTLLDEGKTMYLPLKPGEPQRLNLQGVYDALVELVNCSVRPEQGEG